MVVLIVVVVVDVVVVVVVVVVVWSVESGCHKLSENIWFVWSKMSYSGDKGGMSRLSTAGWTDDGM